MILNFKQKFTSRKVRKNVIRAAEYYLLSGAVFFGKTLACVRHFSVLSMCCCNISQRIGPSDPYTCMIRVLS